jgi:hypothetical protein
VNTAVVVNGAPERKETTVIVFFVVPVRPNRSPMHANFNSAINQYKLLSNLPFHSVFLTS